MSATPAPAYPQDIVYPDSDGMPMADNTRQLRWIVTLFGNLAAHYRLRPDVFVAMDHLWYPVEGEPDVRVAPDVYVVFGRPKGDRGSYQQWKESDVPLTVAVEILSPKHTHWEMRDKFYFYEDHGVEEYYVYDPDVNRLDIFVRGPGGALRPIKSKNFVSPRLGVRFEVTPADLVVYRPDGRRFLTFEELEAEREQGEQRVEEALRLADLSRKARLGTASPQEVQELEQLEARLLPPSL